MLTLRYLLGVLIFTGVFFLGKLIAENGGRLAAAFTHPQPAGVVPARGGSFFVWTGRIFQTIAFIWGFIDAVAVLVLVF